MHDDPDRIRNEIDTIQERMKARAESLGGRLSPNRLMNETVSSVTEHPGRTVDQIIDTIRNHPIASAMVAAGMASVAGASTRDRIANSEAARSTQHNVKTAATRVNERARVAAKSSRDTMNAISETVTETAEDLQERARTTGRKAASTARNASRRAAYGTRTFASDARQFASDNPVALGLFAIGIGALAASVFTARRDSETDSDNATTTGPAVRQAKKQTRAKQQPNKTVKKMKPATNTTRARKAASGTKGAASRATTPTTRGSGSTPATQGQSRQDRNTQATGTKSAGSPGSRTTQSSTSPGTAARGGSDRDGAVLSELNEDNTKSS